MSGGQSGHGGSNCLVDLGDGESGSFAALISQAGLYTKPGTAVCESAIDVGGGQYRGGESIQSVAIVTASAQSARRFVHDGANELLSFFGFAGRSGPIETIEVPTGLTSGAVALRGRDAQGAAYLGVVWQRGRVVGMVQISGTASGSARELARLAAIQDRRLLSYT